MFLSVPILNFPKLARNLSYKIYELLLPSIMDISNNFYSHFIQIYFLLLIYIYIWIIFSHYARRWRNMYLFFSIVYLGMVYFDKLIIGLIWVVGMMLRSSFRWYIESCVNMELWAIPWVYCRNFKVVVW